MSKCILYALMNQRICQTKDNITPQSFSPELYFAKNEIGAPSAARTWLIT